MKRLLHKYDAVSFKVSVRAPPIESFANVIPTLVAYKIAENQVVHPPADSLPLLAICVAEGEL